MMRNTSPVAMSIEKTKYQNVAKGVVLGRSIMTGPIAGMSLYTVVPVVCVLVTSIDVCRTNRPRYCVIRKSMTRISAVFQECFMVSNHNPEAQLNKYSTLEGDCSSGFR